MNRESKFNPGDRVVINAWMESTKSDKNYAVVVEYTAVDEDHVASKFMTVKLDTGKIIYGVWAPYVRLLDPVEVLALSMTEPETAQNA